MFADSTEKDDKSDENVRVLNKSRRGLLYEQNKENMFIDNLMINDNMLKQSLTEVKTAPCLLNFDDRKLLNIEIRNKLDFQDSCKESFLYQINENELENQESSIEKPMELDEPSKDNEGRSKLTSFVEDGPKRPVFPRGSTSLKNSHQRSLSSIKESFRYSNIEEERENTTISKFIHNVDMKYQTNNSEIRRKIEAKEDAYIDDYDECKKNIDFRELSNLRGTPNISNASNMKSYGKYDSESNGKCRKFTRHTREGSIFDTENIPVKEVCMYKIRDMDSDKINTLKSFYEPNNNDDV